MAQRFLQRKALAILAGGLVLGVGAAITLAAWNDSEFATGTFTAGAFNLEGSTDDVTFTSHNTAIGGQTAAAIQFSSGFNNLAPGSVVYAPFWVRLDNATTTNATLAAAGEVSSGTNAANISYAVYAIGPSATCDATATSGTQVASGSSLSAFTAGSSIPLTKGATAGTPGTAVQLCFVATAASTLVQGATATGTWQFTATSN
jgi:predicted ribosomally synthesized peptide with SipW-like signal peptide